MNNAYMKNGGVKWLTAFVACIFLGVSSVSGQNESETVQSTLEEAKVAGAFQSRYRKQVQRIETNEVPQPQLVTFRKEIEPILKKACEQCHGPDLQEGKFRLDVLNPDLLHGPDVSWWLDVVSAMSNGEMPPEDELKMADEDRSKVLQWLSSEIQVASQVRRAEQGHSSFRRMTRYEYNYALQDLLGLPFDFASDLPPEAASPDGFKNSSEMLQMSAIQFEYYRELGRNALLKATVKGKRPELVRFSIPMEDGLNMMRQDYDRKVAQIKSQNKDPQETEKLLKALEKSQPFTINPRTSHFINSKTQKGAPSKYSYHNGRYSFRPNSIPKKVPDVSSTVLVIPVNRNHIFDFGDSLPLNGTLRVRIRASGVAARGQSFPSLRLLLGFQPSNDSRVSNRVSKHDVAIKATPDNPQFYQWEFPLSELPRNTYRKTQKLGGFPNPSEYLTFENVHQNSSLGNLADIRIDYLEVTGPVYKQWPPESHTRIFIDSPHKANETKYAREVLSHFMSRAWRRSVTELELDQKMALFSKLRPGFDDFQETMIEVLAAVLSSPKFLYLTQSAQVDNQHEKRITDYELATRLSMFLWCSTPDNELLELARAGKLSQPDELKKQVDRMLADTRAERFSRHFVRQWLGMQLLDFLKVDKKTYRQFDPFLKEAMQEEPIALFHEVLQQNSSVIDFIHADYAMVNERLARHYGLSEVYGNHFRRVKLDSQSRRGGLLTQAGLLAMNSDGKDSHPLKRSIWLLENLLHDPPPPPPPAVPEIDLTDPDILKLTLKQRMEDHRNDPACMSCHSKIDPWGIVFENFDAIGSWRTTINNEPVDSSAVLFNNQKLDGMDGLKRFLLTHRQDQFTRAMAHKMTSYALGRPLSFADRSSIDQIASQLRKQDDGLATLVALIVTSELFQSN